MTDLNQVTGMGEPVEVPEGTLEPQGVAQTTPETTQPSDVDKVRAEFEQKLVQAQQDLNNVKSALQKRESQITRDYQQQVAALQKQMREVRMQGMDEEQRKQYESQLQNEEFQALQSRLQEYEQKIQEHQQMVDAQEFFKNKGVPADKLVLNQGYDTLVQSGWDWVSQELDRARQLAANPKPSEPAPLKQAPSVITDKSTPATGTTWAELRAKYGTDEQIYQLIEQRQLDPSILPRQ